MIKNSLKLAFISLMMTLVACGGGHDKKPSKRPTPPPVPTTDYLITISTKFGNMKAVLYRETPIHRDNFIKLAKDGFYDGTTFHRVISEFMIQGGDPNSKDSIQGNEGMGGPGYQINPEMNKNLTHKFGTLSSANNGNPQKLSSGSQFFIVENVGGTHHLDNRHTVFGQVIEGLDIIHIIAAQETIDGQTPVENIEMAVEVEELSIEELEKRFGKGYNKQ